GPAEHRWSQHLSRFACGQECRNDCSAFWSRWGRAVLRLRALSDAATSRASHRTLVTCAAPVAPGCLVIDTEWKQQPRQAPGAGVGRVWLPASVFSVTHTLSAGSNCRLIEPGSNRAH